MTYLLDTNVVINYMNASLPISGMQLLNSIVDEISVVSIITKMETLGFNFKSFPEQLAMETFINGSAVLAINNEIVNKTIAIRKERKINLPDAIIAATAIVYNYTLITRNIADFKNIDGLNLINPWEVLS